MEPGDRRLLEDVENNRAPLEVCLRARTVAWLHQSTQSKADSVPVRVETSTKKGIEQWTLQAKKRSSVSHPEIIVWTMESVLESSWSPHWGTQRSPDYSRFEPL